MTPEEMRSVAETTGNQEQRLLATLWLATAEICDRLDKIIARLEAGDDTE